MTEPEPDAWRLKCADCGNVEIWQAEPPMIPVCSECGDGPFGDEGFMETQESFHTSNSIDPVAELLDRAIRDQDWNKAETALSYLAEMTGYKGDWESAGRDSSRRPEILDKAGTTERDKKLG